MLPQRGQADLLRATLSSFQTQDHAPLPQRSAALSYRESISLRPRSARWTQTDRASPAQIVRVSSAPESARSACAPDWPADAADTTKATSPKPGQDLQRPPSSPDGLHTNVRRGKCRPKTACPWLALH